LSVIAAVITASVVASLRADDRDREQEKSAVHGQQLERPEPVQRT
jgi:hypothetical protein